MRVARWEIFAVEDRAENCWPSANVIESGSHPVTVLSLGRASKSALQRENYSPSSPASNRCA
jgi:hypothetical protein